METIGIIIQKLTGGGAERVAANLSIELSKKYNVKLIVFDASDATYKTGGELFDLKLPARKTIIGKIINVLLRTYKVYKIKRNNNIKCSISLMEGANLVNVLSRRNDKIIISERNLVSFFISGKIGRLREIFLAKKSDKIVSLSEMVRQDLIVNFNIPKDKIKTIYNSVDINKLIDNFDSEETHEDILFADKNKKYIVSMGRLTYQKGQWHLLKAFKYIKNSLPDTKLIILGEGELREQLQNFAVKLGIEDDVLFPGYLKKPHGILKKADVFAFSSIVEGLGNVLLEAMACGLPVVSTDCDAGPREILAPDTDVFKKTKEIEKAKYGILTPSFSKEDFNMNDITINNEEKLLGEALIEILENKPLRNHYEVMSKVRVEDFNPDRISEQWDCLIRSLL